MENWKYNYLGLRVFFILAIVVHAAIILVPLTKKVVIEVQGRSSVQVRLLSPPRFLEQPAVVEPLLERREPETSALEELPPAPATVPQPQVREVAGQTPPVNRARVLSSQFDFENRVDEPIFGSVEQQEGAPDFHVRQRTSLEMVLNQPSLQLPFEDTRIYLVDSYDDGIMGGIDRFWDTVSVPFGFTTKNNTRVQCVWVLVIAGCGWGHKSLFHRPARLREKPTEKPVENM